MAKVTPAAGTALRRQLEEELLRIYPNLLGGEVVNLPGVGIVPKGASQLERLLAGSRAMRQDVLGVYPRTEFGQRAYRDLERNLLYELSGLNPQEPNPAAFTGGRAGVATPGARAPINVPGAQLALGPGPVAETAGRATAFNPNAVRSPAAALTDDLIGAAYVPPPSMGAPLAEAVAPAAAEALAPTFTGPLSKRIAPAALERAVASGRSPRTFGMLNFKVDGKPLESLLPEGTPGRIAGLAGKARGKALTETLAEQMAGGAKIGVRPSVGASILGSIAYDALVREPLAEQLDKIDESGLLGDVIANAGGGAIMGAPLGPWGALAGAVGLGGFSALQHAFDFGSYGPGPSEEEQKQNQLAQSLGMGSYEDLTKQLQGYQALAEQTSDQFDANAISARIMDLVNKNVDPQLAYKLVVADPMQTVMTHAQGQLTPDEQKVAALNEFKLLQDRAAQAMIPVAAASQARSDAAIARMREYAGGLSPANRDLLNAQADQLQALGATTNAYAFNPYDRLMEDYGPYLQTQFLGPMALGAKSFQQQLQGQLQSTQPGLFQQSQGQDSLSSLLDQAISQPGDLVSSLLP